LGAQPLLKLFCHAVQAVHAQGFSRKGGQKTLGFGFKKGTQAHHPKAGEPGFGA
jgi:hypothetical protein